MNIKILEPLGVPADLLHREIDALPDTVKVTAYDARPADDAELVARARDAEILVIGNLPLRRSVLEQCPQLRMISVGFVGFDHVDLDYCHERGITVSNCPGYPTQAVAELVILLTLALYRSLKANDAAVRSGGTGAGLRRNEISGKVFGVVGMGEIGRHTAELVRAFGARVIAYNRTPRAVEGVEFLPLDDVMRQADIVSVHVSSTPQTRHLIDARLLSLMKPSAVLINTARGAVIDNAALAQALAQGRIAGAGIDVFDTEPPLPADEPLLAAPNTILAPHIGFATDEALAKRIHQALGNVQAFLDGGPVNLV